LIAAVLIGLVVWILATNNQEMADKTELANTVTLLTAKSVIISGDFFTQGLVMMLVGKTGCVRF
jgi:hypothetical protein